MRDSLNIYSTTCHTHTFKICLTLTCTSMLKDKTTGLHSVAIWMLHWGCVTKQRRLSPSAEWWGKCVFWEGGGEVEVCVRMGVCLCVYWVGGRTQGGGSTGVQREIRSCGISELRSGWGKEKNRWMCRLCSNV